MLSLRGEAEWDSRGPKEGRKEGGDGGASKEEFYESTWEVWREPSHITLILELWRKGGRESGFNCISRISKKMKLS